MIVPFLDLKSIHTKLNDELKSSFNKVLDSGMYILGNEVKSFETEYAEYVNAKHCISVANGLDAITLTLMSLGIGPGDKVLVPSHTFIATWLAVSQVGAIPVAVPVDPVTFNVDVKLLPEYIKPDVKAVIIVHLYGSPCDLEPISVLCKTNNLLLIEDSAQAHGSEYKNQKIGCYADASTFSFYPGKNLGALGDAGAIVTNRSDLCEKLLSLRNYGSKVRYAHDVCGVNSRMDELQAAFLRIRLKYLDHENEIRRNIAAAYRKNLSDFKEVQLQEILPGCKSNWHLFVVRTNERDNLSNYLKEKGIQTLQHYPTVPGLSGAYKKTHGECIVSKQAQNEIADRILSLPMGAHLNENQINYVCESVVSFFKKGH